MAAKIEQIFCLHEVSRTFYQTSYALCKANKLENEFPFFHLCAVIPQYAIAILLLIMNPMQHHSMAKQSSAITRIQCLAD
ncbi:MAG TPA: hypothetical protein PLW09_00865, partial [Candidatus Kapabacteria bacterium]|nr:hypothetical protein [Candidatus Kapabacteria bacterium]